MVISSSALTAGATGCPRTGGRGQPLRLVTIVGVGRRVGLPGHRHGIRVVVGVGRRGRGRDQLKPSHTHCAWAPDVNATAPSPTAVAAPKSTFFIGVLP